MVLFEVYTKETSAMVLNDEAFDLMRNTGLTFESKKQFESHARQFGKDFAGRTWELWSERGSGDRITFKAVTQYEMEMVPKGGEKVPEKAPEKESGKAAGKKGKE